MTDEEHGITRDPETGRILSKKLSSEEASKLAKRSAEVRWSTTATAESLLTEEGYNDTDNIAPTYVKLMAEQAVKNHAAMRDWKKFIHADAAAVETDVNNCQYAEHCVLFAAYQGRADKADIDAARARLHANREHAESRQRAGNGRDE